MKALSDFLRPEFLGRIDEIVVFRPLDEADYRAIAQLMLDEYVESLAEKGIGFRYTGEACALLAEKSLGGKSGARDLRHHIRREVEDRIASLLVERGEGAVSGVALTAAGGALQLEAI